MPVDELRWNECIQNKEPYMPKLTFGSLPVSRASGISRLYTPEQGFAVGVENMDAGGIGNGLMIYYGKTEKLSYVKEAMLAKLNGLSNSQISTAQINLAELNKSATAYTTICNVWKKVFGNQLPYIEKSPRGWLEAVQEIRPVWSRLHVLMQRSGSTTMRFHELEDRTKFNRTIVAEAAVTNNSWVLQFTSPAFQWNTDLNIPADPAQIIKADNVPLRGAAFQRGDGSFYTLYYNRRTALDTPAIDVSERSTMAWPAPEERKAILVLRQATDPKKPEKGGKMLGQAVFDIEPATGAILQGKHTDANYALVQNALKEVQLAATTERTALIMHYNPKAQSLAPTVSVVDPSQNPQAAPVQLASSIPNFKALVGQQQAGMQQRATGTGR